MYRYNQYRESPVEPPEYRERNLEKEFEDRENYLDEKYHDLENEKLIEREKELKKSGEWIRS